MKDTNKNVYQQNKKFFLDTITSNSDFSRLIIFFVMFVTVAILQRNFFRYQSIVRMINGFTPLVLLAMGQAVVMLSGSFDLSIGTALSLLTCVLTSVMKEGVPVTGFYALVIAFVVAMVIGIINGIAVGYLRVPPIIATFATLYIWFGIALFLRPTPGGESVDWFKIFYNVRYLKNLPNIVRQIGLILPPALILLIIGILFWWFISKTKIARYIYAVGGNEESAYESGINTAKVQLQAFMINSVYIFLAALFFVGQNQSGDARMGNPLMLKSIAAAIIGGIALTGGRGNIYYAIVGALIFNFISKIIFFANIPNAYQTLFAGVIIIVTIAASQIYMLYSSKTIRESKIG